MKNVFLVGGTRPNFIKLSPITRAFERNDISFEIVHTGQHYDYEMDEIFFKDFELKKPLVNFNVGSKPHGEQTGEIMQKFERLCFDYDPSLVFVVGDVNSTVACALVAAKLNIPLAHQEAGCRSGSRKTPEEINRVVTDVLSDYLFVSTSDDRDNLLNEGISSERVFLVGDVVIDNLVFHLNKLKQEKSNEKYCLVTIHRNYNTDNEENLTNIVKALGRISENIMIVFPMHPRTKKMIGQFKLSYYLKNVFVTEPLGYLDFICSLRDCSVLITDSGGLQVESTFLNIPCINIREFSSSRFTIENGTNILVGKPNEETIFTKTMSVLENPPKSNLTNEMKKLLDGHASERISTVIRSVLE